MTGKTRLLLVDDNPANLAILEETFSDGYELRSALSGEEALALAEQYRPDIVLLDIMMPGIDGYEVCSRLRSTDGLQYVKIIMVSARAMVGERLKAYDLGADDYVTKPFDIDELQSKVRVFRRLKAVEEIDRLKQDVFALASHEVETPLRCITLPASMLAEDSRMTQDQRRRLGEVIYSNAFRLQQFFRKVRRLGEIRCGPWRPGFDELDLVALVEQLARDFADVARDRGLTVREEYPDRLPLIGDAVALREAIEQIIDNAIRFSLEGKEVRIRVASDGDEATVSVTDQGRGIAEDLIDKVLEEFVEADSKRYHDGPGLSLAVSRELIQAHGGSIAVESTPGVSTSFTIRLPLRPPEGEVVAPPRFASALAVPPDVEGREGPRSERGEAAEGASLVDRRPRVMVVDDNQSNVAILLEALEETCEVSAAYSGEQAMELLANGYAPDIVLLDVMMPGIDGLEVCRRIRKHPRLRLTKILMVSARTEVHERLAGYEAGGDDYVTKPFDTYEILSKVRVYLRLKAVEEVDSLKNRFVSLLASDRSTPLQRILAPADTLRREARVNGDVRQRLGSVILTNANRLREFFARVLLLTTFKSGTARFVRGPVLLADLLRESAEEAQKSLNRPGVEIEHSYPVSPSLAGDKELLGFVFRSLVDNAIRHSHPQGVVSVDVYTDEGETVVTVMDQGKGLSPERLARVFDPIANENEPAKDDDWLQAPGHGLSLATSREIVAAHGGSLTASSLPGQRTTFTVRLPLAASTDEAVQTCQGAATLPGP